MLALKREIAELKRDLVKKDYVHLAVNDEFECKIINPAGVREYKPVPTLKKVHEELYKYTVSGVIGPYGSGKSVGFNWQSILIPAQMMPPCKDGVRRAKAVFVRNTYDQLKQTTHEMFMDWFEDLGSVHSTQKPLEVEIKFNDGKGPIELKVQFYALDKPKQFGKLKSSSFTFGYINEASESPEGIITQVLGRTGRYPSRDQIDLDKVEKWFERDVLENGKWVKEKIPYWSGVIFDSNPPEVDSELYNIFEKEKPRGFKLYRQPPGLIKTDLGWEANPEAENIERLGKNYYSQIAQGATEEFIKVYCCGEYGSIKTGKLIYNEYNDNIHAQENLEYFPETGIRLSFDTWYQPACTISQYANQQLRVLATLHESDMGMELFANSVVKPYLEQHFPGYTIQNITMDPAGKAGTSACGVLSDYQAVKKVFGSNVRLAVSNDPDVRHDAVRHFLTRLNGGLPAFVLDKDKCKDLRGGFLKHYVWQQSTGGKVIYKAKKNKQSHTHDALQYECLSIIPQTDEFAKKQSPASKFLKPIQHIPQHRSQYYA